MMGPGTARTSFPAAPAAGSPWPHFVNGEGNPTGGRDRGGFAPSSGMS